MAERNKTNGSSGGRADKKELAVNQLEPVSCAAPKITEIIIIMTRTTATARKTATATIRRTATWAASAKESNCEYTLVNVNVDYNFACLLTTFLLRRVCVCMCLYWCVCVLRFRGLAPRAPWDHPFLLDHRVNVSQPSRVFVGFLASLGVNSIKVICCRHF